MSVRIKVSYEKEEELSMVLRLLKPMLKKCSKAAGKNGRFFRAYITLDNRKQ